MIWDITIIGAGAAGLMTAIHATGGNRRVLLLDSKERIGAKILMSGGTRCNVTNLQVDVKDFQSEHPRVVRNILSAYPSSKAVNFFESIGVILALEEGGKFFPETQSAKTVLEGLLSEVKNRNVDLVTGRRVESVEVDLASFHIRGKGFEYESKTVVICTGGLSYPGTGSDGKGYEIARHFGHSLIETMPALTPLSTNDPDWKSLSGLSLFCRLVLKTGVKERASYEDSFLFTHFGFSGPSVLDISRHWLHWKKEEPILTANFLPKETEETLRATLLEMTTEHFDWTLKRFLCEKLPERLVEIILKKSSIPKDQRLKQLKKEAREVLIRNLFRMPLSITGVFGYQKAEVTAGGVTLDDLDPRTLESKRQPGLFFAGEVVDVDGRIGGFNFQWAWASGVAAALGAIQRLI
ncbi:MAG: NAD(P)/FAD-dependent oxidoreductase [Candidatus Omnitrophica bacterium]|nr:NAD(P)/FAD-dependent oxidoreductase [Candidatus Omnitrophota bacterium]